MQGLPSSFFDIMVPSSSGSGRSPFTREIAGSNPAGTTYVELRERSKRLGSQPSVHGFEPHTPYHARLRESGLNDRSFKAA